MKSIELALSMCDIVDIYGFTVDPGYTEWLALIFLLILFHFPSIYNLLMSLLFSSVSQLIVICHCLVCWLDIYFLFVSGYHQVSLFTCYTLCCYLCILAHLCHDPYDRTRYFSTPRKGHNPLQGRAYYQLLECLGVRIFSLHFTLFPPLRSYHTLLLPQAHMHQLFSLNV